MRTILLIASNTLKRIFRKKTNIVLFILLPIIIIGAMMYLFGNAGTGTTTIGVYNKDNGNLGHEFTNSIGTVEKFKVSSVKEEDINELVSTQKIDCVIILPQDFSANLYAGNSVKVEMKTIKGEDTTIWIENFTNMLINNLRDIGSASKGDKELFEKILKGYNDGQLKIKINKVEDVVLSRETTTSSIGFLIMFMMFATSMTASMLIKERQDRTFNRVLTAPINSKVLVLGNTLANMVIIVIQSILVALTINYVLKINSGIQAWQLVIILVSFGLVAISIGMMIVSFSSTTAQSGNLSSLITTPTSMLGGCFWSVSFMPDALQKVSNFMPQRWALKAIERLQQGSNFSDILINIAVLLAFALVFSTIAVYRFKSNDSMENFV